jgi:glycosyltransferase involved in cell wall biosynthesis
MSSDLVSIVIPAYNEPFLHETIISLHEAAKGPIEIIAVLDGYWPGQPLEGNCVVIHSASDLGMRTAINAGARIARGKYLMKCDAHCVFKPGFDTILKNDCQDNWMLVPVLYGMDMDNWRRKGRRREFQYIRKSDMKGQDWPDFAKRCEGQKLCDLLTSQGSCWFTTLDWFKKIGMEDDVNYGKGGREAQEISLKTWTQGGRYVLDRNVWYAHWRKPRAYATKRRSNRKKSAEYAVKHWQGEIDISWLIQKFAPVPTWE